MVPPLIYMFPLESRPSLPEAVSINLPPVICDVTGRVDTVVGGGYFYRSSCYRQYRFVYALSFFTRSGHRDGKTAIDIQITFGLWSLAELVDW